jgi:hypothetical protein
MTLKGQKRIFWVILDRNNNRIKSMFKVANIIFFPYALDFASLGYKFKIVIVFSKK